MFFSFLIVLGVSAAVGYASGDEAHQPTKRFSRQYGAEDSSMSAYRRFACVLTWFLGSMWATTAVGADNRRDPPPQRDTLQSVLDRIRDHAAAEAWKQEGWREDYVEAWLDKLVASIAHGTELPQLKVPVRLADVAPADPARPVLGGGLFVGRDQKISSLRNSIVLADGNVEVMMVENSVVVARGCVSATMARGSLIVAGSYVQLSMAGAPNGAPEDNNLIVTRGWADVRSAYGTIFVAGEGATTSRAQDCIFVNAEPPAVRLPAIRANTTRSVKIADLPLEPLTVHPLSARIELLGMIQTRDDGPLPNRSEMQHAGIVFRFDGRRYVADIGKPIVDEAGTPVESLRGWKLTHAAGSTAVFDNGAAEAIVRAQSP
jgi:hypothetical protein